MGKMMAEKARVAAEKKRKQAEQQRITQEKLERKNQAAADQAETFGEAALPQAEGSDPKLLTALLGSTHLLKKACDGAFRKFDTNSDGVLEGAEVHALVAHLCEQVGVTT